VLILFSQLAKERSDEIDRDNYTLLKKMQHIMDTEGQVEHKHAYKHHRYIHHYW